jgi:transposase
MVPSGAETPKSRTPKAIHRRLTQTQISALIVDYERGVKIRDLAKKYRIGRQTVTLITQRARARPRYPALLPEEVQQAAELYKSRLSLAVVGEYFGVNSSTIRKALVAIGVAMRDSHGREK